MVLLELNECIAVKNNQVLLLITFQARGAGVIVNDIAQRSNENENIEYDGYKLRLDVEN